MSTHNICFCWEIRKISAFFGWKKRLICCYEFHINIESSQVYCYSFLPSCSIFSHYNVMYSEICIFKISSTCIWWLWLGYVSFFHCLLYFSMSTLEMEGEHTVFVADPCSIGIGGLMVSYALWKHAYLNMLKILSPKIQNFQIKNSDILHISAQNIDCGYSLELSHWGSSNAYP